MRSHILVVTVAALTAALIGCAGDESSETARTVVPTPPAVREEFHALLETVDENRPGASVESLQAFLVANRYFMIADTVEYEIQYFRAAADGRYHVAREMAREGEFALAEHILQDLALMPDTPDGENAVKHLKFDFYFGKAQWLMIRQRFPESAVVARALLERDLTPSQADQVEAILDNAGNFDAALGQAELHSAQSACRQLGIMLATMYVEEGVYPNQFTLSDVERWDGYGYKSITRGLSSIENYRATQRGYSFEAVSAQGRHRLRVVDGDIQDM